MAVTPFGRGADADFHLSSIWCANGLSENRCLEGSSPETRLVPNIFVNQCRVAGRYVDVCISDTDLPQHRIQLAETDRLNGQGMYTGLYPSTFYVLSSLAISRNIDLSILILRFGNIMFFAFLFGLAIFVSRKRHQRLIFLAVLTALPGLLSILVFVTPQAWAISGVSFGWCFVYALLDQGKNARNANWQAWIGLIFSGLLSLMSRADAFMMFGASLIIVGALVRSDSIETKSRAWLVIAISAVLVSIAAFSHPVSRSAVFGILSGEKLFSRYSFSESEILFHTIIAFPEFLLQSFSGWIEVTSDPPAVGPSGFFICLIVGLIIAEQMRIGTRTSGLIATAAFFVPFGYTVVANQNYGQVLGNEFPPRYLALFLVSVIGLALVALDHRPSPQISRRAVQSVVFFGFLSVSWFLHVFIRTSVSGRNLNIANMNLNEAVVWWSSMPLSPMTTWILLCVLLWVMWRVVDDKKHLDEVR